MTINRIILFNLLILSTYVICTNDNTDEKCDDLHPSCLFVIAVGLSGSTSVMDILNQHPKIHLRGENDGLFTRIMKIMYKIKWSLDYDKALQEKNYGNITFFSTITKEIAYRGVGQMFKQFYGHGDNSDKMVGFKEIRIFSKEQIDFVRGLCENSKVVFQYSTDIEKVLKKGWFKSNPEKYRKGISNNIKVFQTYNYQYPNDTYITTLQDFSKPDFVENLFDFLGLSLDGVDIDVARLYKMDQQKKHHKHA